MATKERQKSGTFIRKAELARELNIDRKTLDRRIADGLIPPPHSRHGERIANWLRRDLDYFIEHRAWPRESFPTR